MVQQGAVDLSAVADEDLPRALELARRLYGGESLRDFIIRLSPHLPPPRHYAPILAKLEEARRRPIKLGFSMPPRHGKTVLIQHAIPWWLTHFPADTCAYASYSDRQAWTKSRVIRAIAENAGIRLAHDAANLAEWRTLAGGGLLSGGAGSGLTGNAVNGLLVVDDPFKNPEEANSQIIRDKIGEWFETVVTTRDEGMSTIVFHTRWHADDLIGRLMSDEEFEIINLPALAEENDILGRAVGEALWPDRGLPGFTKEGLEKRQKRNPWAFAALYQGRPRPRGDTIFGEPHYYNPATTDFTGCRYVLAADPAASEKTAADFSAAVVLSVMGTGDNMKAYVRHVYRQQVTVPQFANDLLALQHRFAEARINVEAVGAFKAIPQMLRAVKADLRVTEIQPLGDKLLRAQPAAAAWNAARLLLPDDSPSWLGDFLDELAKFTGVRDAHDDQCLAADTVVETWRGAIPISSIEPGEYVWTRRGLRRVVAAAMTGVRRTLVVHLSTGGSFRATANHPIIDWYGRIIQVDELYHVCIMQGWSTRLNSWGSSSGVIPIRRSPPIVATIGLGSPTPSVVSSRFTRRSGRIAMAPFPLGTTSTTSTRTRSTTIHPISNASRNASIAASIQTSDERQNSLLTYVKFGHSQPRGTNLRLGAPGIPTTGKIPGRTESLRSIHVPRAANRSWLTEERSPSIALMLAENVDGGRESALTVNASFAEPRFSAVPRPVPVHVVRVPFGRLEPVYNLAVEGEHEYFAAGVLMHNCDALAHAWNSAVKTAPEPPSYDYSEGPILPRRY